MPRSEEDADDLADGRVNLFFRGDALESLSFYSPGSAKPTTVSPDHDSLKALAICMLVYRAQSGSRGETIFYTTKARKSPRRTLANALEAQGTSPVITLLEHLHSGKAQHEQLFPRSLGVNRAGKKEDKPIKIAIDSSFLPPKNVKIVRSHDQAQEEIKSAKDILTLAHSIWKTPKLDEWIHDDPLEGISVPAAQEPPAESNLFDQSIPEKKSDPPYLETAPRSSMKPYWVWTGVAFCTFLGWRVWSTYWPSWMPLSTMRVIKDSGPVDLLYHDGRYETLGNVVFAASSIVLLFWLVEIVRRTQNLAVEPAKTRGS